ncbi:MAG: bifunctional oligoribonuclease/PAP phosphatase NrnA [Spirochaetales bacterium]|nr:bifunctional oligoribonuclease/PAP phosphatase NrnA [Spirochaetales bacterium]
MNHDVPQEILHILREKNHFLLFGHSDPDGDCVTSQLVAASFLRRLGKTARCIAEKPFTRRDILRFFPFFELPTGETDDPEKTAVVAVDCSTRDRIAGYSEALSSLPLVMIDHHSSGSPFGTTRYVDPQAPSTTVLIYRIMIALGETPSPEEAELLLFGLCTDTGFFRHLESGSGEVLQMAGELTNLGASLKKIHSLMYGDRTLGSRVLLGKILSRLEPLGDHRVLFTFMTREDIKEFGEEAKDSDTLYSLLQGVEQVVMVVLAREESDGTRTVGIRTNHTLDAGELASRFGGGGHQRAAGFSSTKTIGALKDDLEKAVFNMLIPGTKNLP